MNTSRQHVRSRLGVLLTLAALAAAGCSDATKPGGKDEPGVQPDPTPVGTAAGPVVTKSIGPEGGSLTSADGGLTLTVPAGAVAAATQFGVQPITNESPGGVGQAYRLTPPGQSFAKPVQLSLRFSPAELADAAATGLAVAYQDGNGGWWGILSTSLDEATNTVSVSTTRLAPTPPALSRVPGASLARASSAASGGAPESADWASGWVWFLEIPRPSTVGVGERSTLQVSACINDERLNEWIARADVDAMAAGLPKALCEPSKLSWSWSVNGVPAGNSAVGTIATALVGSATSQAVYTAPAQLPNPNPVTVKVEMTGVPAGSRLPVAMRVKRMGIRVEDPKFRVHIKAVYQETIPIAANGLIIADVTDEFGLELNVASGEVSEIRNVQSIVGGARFAERPGDYCGFTLGGPYEHFTITGGSALRLGGVAAGLSLSHRITIPWAAVDFKYNDGCKSLEFQGYDGPTGGTLDLAFPIDAKVLLKAGDNYVLRQDEAGAKWTITVVRM